MKAAQLHAYEEEGLHPDEVPEPTIEGPHDVIVRIGGAGLCRTDLHIDEWGHVQRSGELMTLAAQGKVQLHTRAYPLAAVNEAMADLAVGRLQGRGILVP